MRAKTAEEKCGTLSGYKQGCRCDRCKSENNRRAAKYRKILSEQNVRWKSSRYKPGDEYYNPVNYSEAPLNLRDPDELCNYKFRS